MSVGREEDNADSLERRVLRMIPFARMELTAMRSCGEDQTDEGAVVMVARRDDDDSCQQRSGAGGARSREECGGRRAAVAARCGAGGERRAGAWWRGPSEAIGGGARGPVLRTRSSTRTRCREGTRWTGPASRPTGTPLACLSHDDGASGADDTDARCLGALCDRALVRDDCVLAM